MSTFDSRGDDEIADTGGSNGSIRMNKLHRILLLLPLLLCGCSSDWMAAQERSEQAVRAPPTNYRGDIVAFMRTYLNDPNRVRDAFVSEPAMKTLDHVDRYVVCLRYNARKSGGQYAGSKDSLVLFRDGRLDRVVDNAREQCRDAAYQPFPELERMTR